jgi:hypothetical protein
MILLIAKMTVQQFDHDGSHSNKMMMVAQTPIIMKIAKEQFSCDDGRTNKPFDCDEWLRMNGSIAMKITKERITMNK